MVGYSYYKAMKIMKLRQLYVIMLIIVLGFTGLVHANNAIHGFGDCMTDTGNIFYYENIPVYPYINGRFANGGNYVDLMAGQVAGWDSTAWANGGNIGAFGSAETGSGNSVLGVPNVLDQIVGYQSTYLPGGTYDPTDYILLFAGHNDILSPVLYGGSIPPVSDTVDNLTTALGLITESLGNGGAEGKKVILPTLMPIESMPVVAGIEDTVKTWVDQLNDQTRAFALPGAIPGVTVYRPDLTTLMRDVLANPADYGLSEYNVNAVAYDGWYSGGGTVADNPNSHFWWDNDGHVTVSVHAIMADYILDVVYGGGTYQIRSDDYVGSKYTIDTLNITYTADVDGTITSIARDGSKATSIITAQVLGAQAYNTLSSMTSLDVSVNNVVLTVDSAFSIPNASINIDPDNLGSLTATLASSGGNSINADKLTFLSKDDILNITNNTDLSVNSLEVSGSNTLIDHAATCVLTAPSITIAEGADLTLNNSGNVNLTNADIHGTFTVSNGIAAAGISNGGQFAVSKTGKLVSSIDLSGSAANGLTLDLGVSGGGTVLNGSGKFAEVTGQIKTSGDKNTDTSIVNVFGINGISGTTYKDVFSTAIVDSNNSVYDDGGLLSTVDGYRIYTITNSGKDIAVSTDTSGVTASITAAGGSQKDASTLNGLLSSQASFDTAGKEYVNSLISLSPSDQVRAIEQYRGEQSTTATSQAAIQGIIAAGGATSQKMTAFRSGSLAQGMASSFSSSGATSATENMADAETLAAVYESASYTATEPVYNTTNIWANAFGGFGDQGSCCNMNGYSFYNVGVMVGMDYTISRELRVGGLLGYSYNKADIYNSMGKSIDNNIRFGGYLSYNWDRFFTDFSATSGIHAIESTRNLLVNNAKAANRRTGIDTSTNIKIGYDFELPHNITLTPDTGLTYTMFYDPDYTETGAGAQNLSYNSFTSHSLVQDTGLRLGKFVNLRDSLSLLPEVWGGWEIEYLNTGGTRNTTTSSSLGAATYASSMNSMATNRFYFGAGVTALVGENTSVFARYDHKIWSDGYNAGFALGVKISF